MKVSAAAFVISLAMQVSPVMGQSLVDRARQEGGSAGSIVDVCGPMPSLAEVLSLSDLVVHGRVVELKTGLYSDESLVTTSTRLHPFRRSRTSVPHPWRDQGRSPRSWFGDLAARY